MGKCAKRDVVAIIECDGALYVGTNACDNPQEVCPRKDLPTGEEYGLCVSVCGQKCHAEINACLQAPTTMKNAIMYLIGHTYCCNDCLETMKAYGISQVEILNNGIRKRLMLPGDQIGDHQETTSNGNIVQTDQGGA